MNQSTTIVQARINEDLKEKSNVIFKDLGITHSQAIKIFYDQVVNHQGIPFQLRKGKVDASLQANKRAGTSLSYDDSDPSIRELTQSAATIFRDTTEDRKSDNFDKSKIKPINYDEYK